MPDRFLQALELKKLFLSLLFLYVQAAQSKTEAFFTQETNITKKLIEYISNAKRRIYIAMYMLTDKQIANAIIHAKGKNAKLDIQVVTDTISAESIYGKVPLLKQNNMNVFICQNKKACKEKQSRPWGNGPIMHNKYAIIDDTVWTGSFNFTVAANRYNWENVIITTNKQTVQKYLANFATLKGNSKPYQEAEPENNLINFVKSACRDFLSTCKATTRRHFPLS